MASGTKTAKALKVCCSNCMASEGITINLNSLNGRKTECTCDSCGESFTARDAAEKLRDEAEKWAKVADWLENAPIVD